MGATSPSLILTALANALHAASISKLTLLPSPEAIELLQHFDLTGLRAHFCFTTEEVAKPP